MLDSRLSEIVLKLTSVIHECVVDAFFSGSSGGCKPAVYFHRATDMLSSCLSTPAKSTMSHLQRGADGVVLAVRDAQNISSSTLVTGVSTWVAW